MCFLSLYNVLQIKCKPTEFSCHCTWGFLKMTWIGMMSPFKRNGDVIELKLLNSRHMNKSINQSNILWVHYKNVLIYESMVEYRGKNINGVFIHVFVPTRQTVVGEIGPQFVIFLINHSVWYFSLEICVQCCEYKKGMQTEPIIGIATKETLMVQTGQALTSISDKAHHEKGNRAMLLVLIVSTDKHYATIQSCLQVATANATSQVKLFNKVLSFY